MPDPGRLRIAQIAPVAQPVRRGAGDSIEQLVGALCDGLVRRGHDVTLYATGDSETTARLRAERPVGYDEDEHLWDWQFAESVNAAAAFAHADDHDVIHAHDLHFALPFARLTTVPFVETQHVDSSPEVRMAQRRTTTAHLIAASAQHKASLGPGLDVTVIPHGIDVDAFPFSDVVGDYLLYLGRLLPDKGPLDAIRIARAADMPIILAGAEVEGEDHGIGPLLDGDRVRWIGPVDHAARDRLLCGAAALLFPITYPEPFGLVMIEAMACGTPVLGTACGAVPELVDHGVTGFVEATWEGLADRVPAALALDRARIRETARARFDLERMIDEHEAFYRRLVA